MLQLTLPGHDNGPIFLESPKDAVVPRQKEVILTQSPHSQEVGHVTFGHLVFGGFIIVWGELVASYCCSRSGKKLNKDWIQ